MKIYQWRGITSEGRIATGEIAAPNLTLAKAEILKSRIWPQKIERQFLVSTRIKPDTLIAFTEQLAALIESGIDLLSALEILHDTFQQPALKRVLIQIIRSLKQGKSLSQSLGEEERYFDFLYCTLIRLGEETGHLDSMLTKLCDYQQKKRLFKQQLVKALFYPGFILISALIAVSVIMIFVIPSFEKIFASFHHTLPAITLAVIATAHFLGQYFLMIAGTMIALIFIAKGLYQKYLGLRSRSQNLLLKLPLLGGFIETLLLSRLLFYLALMLKAGLPLLPSIETLIGLIRFLPYQQALKDAKKQLSEGQSLWHSLQQSGRFPVLMVQMIKVGETSGRLDDMLMRTAHYYQERLALYMSQLQILLEPILLLVLAVIIGGVVIAMYAPIFTLGSVF